MISLRVNSALQKLAADLRVARKRRRMSVKDFATRVGVSDATIMRLEKGDPGVRIEVLVSALHVLGRLNALTDILDIGRDDIGLMMEVENLPARIDRGRRRSPAAGQTQAEEMTAAPDDEGEAF